MTSIAEQIIAARRAKGMTQDALARALTVSRVSISNWETGRRTPDSEMLLRLAEVLDCRFELPQPEEEPEPFDEPDPLPEDIPEPEAPPEPAEPEAPAKGRSPRRMILLAAAAIVLLALCAWRLALPARKNDAPEAVPPVDGEITVANASPAYFRQDNPNRPGQPYLSVESVLRTLKGSGEDMWMYTITYHELNGFPLSILRVESYVFVGDAIRSMIVPAETLEGEGLATRIDAHGDWSVEGGFPVRDDVRGVGFVLRGEDDSGEPLSFVFYLPLST